MREYGPDFLLDLFRQPLEPGYAQAARRRATAPPPRGWRRGASPATRLLLIAFIGFLLTVAYQYAAAGQPDRSAARSSLVADVKARRAETDDLQRQAEQLREDVTHLRDSALAGDGQEETRLRDLEGATGLAGVRGDGVVVAVADARPKIDPVTGKQATDNLGVVRDRDLQDIANELWRDGAEAVAINGERLTSTSTIRAAGGAILVDFRVVTGPYQVAAIGADELEKRFTGSLTARRFHGYVDAYHMQYSIKKQSKLTLPAAPESQLRFAHGPEASPSVPPGGSGSAATSRPSGPSSPSPLPSASGGSR
jgi:uncharacterized protein YlxW (UPF0749 family)